MESTTARSNVVQTDFSYTPRKIWSDYGLETYDEFYKGLPTNMQTIIYKGRFIAHRSKDYYVFPHEDIFVTIDPVMAMLKGEPISEHIRNEHRLELVYGQNRKVVAETNWNNFGGKHVNQGARIRATYLFKDERFDVSGNGDFVTFGATFGNGIDGGMSLQISPFSLRETCTNGMQHAATVVEISEGIMAKMRTKESLETMNQSIIKDHVSRIMEESKSFDDLIAKVKKERMSHLTKIPFEWITSRVFLIKESVSMFRARYREMTELLISQHQAELIAKEMPKRLVEKLEWMQVKDEFEEIKDKDGNVKKVLKQVVKLDPTKQWKGFNDMTENLTHVERAFQSKTDNYRKLDKILVLNKQ